MIWFKEFYEKLKLLLVLKDWSKYDGSNLAKSIIIEAAELLRTFSMEWRWL